MKVFVGMSGGVDSSTTAALLKDAGHEVTGVFMKNWTKDVLGFECPWRQDLADAKSVAAQLKIPIKVYDFQEQYKQKVVDYMVKEYQAGRTPNPDIMCNQEIKFKLFLNTALEDGADRIATGHYARIVKSEKSKVKSESDNKPKQQAGRDKSFDLDQGDKEGRIELHEGKDKNKDQSYFLCRISEAALEKTLMPLGNKTKPEVRKLAEDFNLPVADKPDSVGICFIGEVSIQEFLDQYIETEPGPIKTKDGEIIGEHDGAVFYTIGQRKGLGIGGGLPYYVVAKNMEENTVYVTTDLQDLTLNTKEFTVSEVHWINQQPDLDQKYSVRTRYRADKVPCQIKKDGKNLKVILDHRQRAITAGQSAVVYEGEQVLGGGIIEPPLPRREFMAD